MEIKELHLRNIASIEKADIDFTKDLVDRGTSDPASVFLISGDTGAGKSVILDGIAMALYKKTPRTEGVANKKENSYKDASGETISINSLEQYTRIGISEKDECYSELVFVGNDNVEYRAKLSLGMLLGKTDKVTGLRPMKHRGAAWEVKIGAADWTKCTDEIISNAVGLSFEQFSRMAMLPQGKFETFLTGDKKERESILEQLTNTAKFTEFGNAIKSLMDRAKSVRDTTQTKYDTEKGHSLSDEEIEQCNAELDSASNGKDNVEARISANDTELGHVTEIEKASNLLAEASARKDALEAEVLGDKYKAAKALVADWQATVEVRQRLVDLRRERNHKAESLDNEAACRDEFGVLSSDLEAKADAVSRAAGALENEKEWLDDNQSRDGLYTNAAVILGKMGSYAQTLNELARASESLAGAEGRKGGLETAVNEAKKVAEDANSLVAAKQGDIDTLTSKRAGIDPERVNNDISAANARRQNLQDLKTLSSTVEGKKASVLEQRKAIMEDKKALAGLKQAANEAEDVLRKAKSEYELTLGRYNVMGQSVEDTLTNIRQELAETHTDVCPLCGQHIDNLQIEDKLRDMLTPLQEEKNRAKAAMDLADEACKTATKNQNTAQGKLENKESALESFESELTKDAHKLVQGVAKAGFDVTQPSAGQIDTAIVEVEDLLKGLREKQTLAETIQKQITALIKEKKPLDDSKAKADQALRAAEKAFFDNDGDIKAARQAVITFESQKLGLETELTDALAEFYPDWKADLQASITALDIESKAYMGRKQNWIDGSAKLKEDRSLVNAIEDIRSEVLKIHADWNGKSVPADAGRTNVKGDWTTLLSSVAKIASDIESCNSKINECTTVLDVYYRTSGKDEAFLDSVAAGKDRLEASSGLVKNVDEALKSTGDAVNMYQSQIETAMAALGAKDRSEIPAKETLLDKKAELDKEKEGYVGTIASVKKKLEDNASNNKTLKVLGDELATAQKTLDKWTLLNKYFGGTRFRTLVQTYILRPLLINANIYLERITDRYSLTCSDENEQLSILVLDRYNKNQTRSVTVLSGGEKFMISLALSLALSSLNRPGLNVNILFIDEGFGTLDEKSLDSVMQTLERLQEIAGESKRRVGIISHREELDERVPSQIRVVKKGEGRSRVEIKN